jgi:hypothetical protein
MDLDMPFAEYVMVIFRLCTVIFMASGFTFRPGVCFSQG